MADTIITDNDKRKRQRSPAYPYINLESALKRAKEFYVKETRNAVNIKVAAKHWGYEEKSSAGQQTAAALISFGLLQDSGMGNLRKLQLTQNALRILLDNRPDSTDLMQAIKTAALTPKIHQELWKKYGIDLPSDDTLRFTLTAEWVPPFNDNTVDGFIREYKSTIAFAKLSDSDKFTAIEDDQSTEPGNFPNEHNFASKSEEYVQAVLSKQSSPDKPIQSVGNRFQTPQIPMGQNMRQDVFSLVEGNATFQWPIPLSTDSIQDLKDWLKILERKISRPTPTKHETSDIRE